ncbi:DUF3930 family protein [Ectobacillus polymachus]|uniref:DUF3930 family protein n=1 Tax=Ectobacillus polymachus TaxID=1508806 RepID=UPI003A847087
MIKQQTSFETEKAGTFSFLADEKLDIVMDRMIQVLIRFLTVVGIPYTIYLILQLLFSF